MQVYVDEMIVKSCTVEAHATNLEEVFARMRKFDMGLIPEKLFSV